MIGPFSRSTLWVAAALALAGCGLKGSLALPSQSDEVVIRGAGQTAPEAGTAPSEAGVTPADPAAVPAVKKPARRENRPPPPPLPGGNPGTARGG